MGEASRFFRQQQDAGLMGAGPTEGETAGEEVGAGKRGIGASAFAKATA